MTLHWIELNQTPIFEQLCLEELLLRTDERSFCIVNWGSPRAIVLGISGKAHELIDLTRWNNDPVPLIRRCSGGGTVIVDEQTLFISFLFSKDLFPIAPLPEPILRWTSSLYQNAWKLPGFSACDNDYVIGEKKCGGNAQYIRKNRWLHHTSFLFDYRTENMEYLVLPPKRPLYRKDRSHAEFLCRLKTYSQGPQSLISQLKQELSGRISLCEMSQEELDWLKKNRSYRQATIDISQEIRTACSTNPSR